MAEIRVRLIQARPRLVIACANVSNLFVVRVIDEATIDSQLKLC
jgi:hypothetical protein